MSLVALGSSLTVGAAPSFPKAYKTSLETPEVYQALMPGVNSQSDLLCAVQEVVGPIFTRSTI